MERERAKYFLQVNCSLVANKQTEFVSKWNCITLKYQNVQSQEELGFDFLKPNRLRLSPISRSMGSIIFYNERMERETYVFATISQTAHATKCG